MFALTVDHDIKSNTKARKIGYYVATIKSHEKPQARRRCSVLCILKVPWTETLTQSRWEFSF
jgi:hypothetical protein